MHPEEKAARNRVWRDLKRMSEQWEAREGQTALQCARELSDYLAIWGAPKPRGRP